MIFIIASWKFWTRSNLIGASASGLKDLTLQIYGCDSVHWLDLTIEETQSYSYTNVACDNFNWQLAGTTHSSSGTYTFTEFTSLYVPTHTLNLTINNSSANSVSVVACDSYEWDGVTYDSTGSYTNTYADVNGCDSVVTLVLQSIVVQSLLLLYKKRLLRLGWCYIQYNGNIHK